MKTHRLVGLAFVVIVTTATSGMAQIPSTINVTITDDACEFSASSLSAGAQNSSSVLPQGIQTSRVTFDPMVLVKNIDKCSIPLYKRLWKGSRINEIVVSLQNGQISVLKLTLGNVIVSSISDTDSSAGPSERITLVYQFITIFDPVDHLTTTCNVLTNSCS